MNARAHKLCRKFKITPDAGGKLVDAGLDTVNKVKVAKRSDLEKAIGRKAAEKIKRIGNGV